MSLQVWAGLHNAARGIDESGAATAERILSDIRRAQKALMPDGPYKWAEILDLDFMHALDLRLHDPLTDRWVCHCIPYNAVMQDAAIAITQSLQLMIDMLDKPAEYAVQS